MPVTVVGPDKQTYQFPDGTDKTAAIAYFKKKGIGLPSVTGTAHAVDWRDKWTEPSRQSDTPVHAVEDVLGNVGGAMFSVPLHPIETAKGIFRISPFGEVIDLAGGKEPAFAEMWDQARQHPLEAVEGAIGQGLAFGGMGEVGDLAGRVVPPAFRGGLDALAGTGKGVTRELVKSTEAANTAADAYSGVRARIETARNNALKIGNEKYSAVNPALNPIEADPEFMQGALADALESLKGSKSEPTLLKDIAKKQERGDAFTYEDLQGDYSRLGKELSKGTLPGDEFHAYDLLHEAIGEEMQRIADSEGKGAELKDARDYWRRMKQTFGKPLSETDAATGVLRSTAPNLAEKSTMANRIRLLGSFDPEIPGAFDALEKAQKGAKGVEPTTPGEKKTIGAEDVQGAKKVGLHQRTEMVHRKGLWLSAGPAFYAAADILRGEMPTAGGLVGATVAPMVLQSALIKLLTNEKVVEFLTKATPADVAQIPPDLRGSFPAIVKAAQAKGIRISPALAAAGAVLPPHHALNQAPPPQSGPKHPTFSAQSPVQ